MRFKVIVQSISTAGIAGDAADLTPAMELGEAQKRLARLIDGKGARPTPDGWMCVGRDGTRFIVSLERCQPVSATGTSLVQAYHQAGATA